MTDPTGAIDRGTSADLTRMIARGGAWAIGARVARTAVTVLGMAVLARLLTPADFGVLALSLSASLLSLALLEGFIDFPSLRHDDFSSSALRSLIWVSILILGVIASAIWALAPLIERWMQFPRLAIGLRFVCPLLIAQVFITAGVAILRRQHRFHIAAIIHVSTAILYFGPAILFALAGYGLYSVLLAQALSQVATALALIVAARVPVLPPRTLDLSGVGHTGTYGAGSRLLAWMATNIDTIAIGAALGPTATGLYSRAYNISVQLKEPFIALDAIVRQALAALKNREAGFEQQVDRAIRLLMVSSSFVAAAAFMMREEIVAVLLGPAFLSCAPILAALAIGLPGRVMFVFRDSMATALGAMQAMTLRNAILLVALAGGAIAAAPFGGVWVGLVVSGATYLALFAPTGEARVTGLGAARFARLLAPGVTAGIAVAAGGEALLDLLDGGLWLRIAAGGAYLAVAAIVLVMLVPRSWLGGRLAKLRARLIGAGQPAAR